MKDQAPLTALSAHRTALLLTFLLALAGCTESWEIRLPTWNEFTPLSVIDMETALFVLSELTRSAMRPPQPVLNGWSGMLLCHWAC